MDTTSPPTPRERHKGSLVSCWIEPFWKKLLQERAAALGLPSLSDYMKTILKYSVLQDMGLDVETAGDGRPFVPGMTPDRIRAFWKQLVGFRTLPGRTGEFTVPCQTDRLFLSLAPPPTPSSPPSADARAGFMKGWVRRGR
jgi:hypothetical protein